MDLPYSLISQLEKVPDNQKAKGLPPVHLWYPEAAFDPQCNWPNIMGNATVPMLGLQSTGTAGAEVLLESLFSKAEDAIKTAVKK